jgi:hypothetical protein
MGQFEYLSVLVSIIIGLALAQLLSGAARLIQLRHRIRMHGTTLCWMLSLFLMGVQVWWVAFERRDVEDWEYFSFLLYLMIPVLLYLLGVLVLPDMGDEDAADLQANFDGNRSWFFALLGGIVLVSLGEQALRDGGLPLDGDVAFRVVFLVATLVAARVANARFHFWNALAVLAGFLGYIALLFVRLE